MINNQIDEEAEVNLDTYDLLTLIDDEVLQDPDLVDDLDDADDLYREDYLENLAAQYE